MPFAPVSSAKYLLAALLILAAAPVSADPLLSTTPRFRIAQSQETAQLVVRLQELEERVRVLTGQVEGLQFQLTQMQTMLERLSATGAPAQPDPSALPADPNLIAPEAPAEVLGPTDVPMDDIGSSHDPLIGTDGTDTAALGTLPGDDTARPLDLTLGGDGGQTNGDANAQYRAGYDAIVRGDYAFAEEQFRQFVALYPEDPQAADATNWLGEALIQRGAFDDAADVLLTGFQKYRESPRAPDMLLKLGVALLGANEPEAACRTYLEIGRNFPETTPAFKKRLAEEAARAQCPA